MVHTLFVMFVQDRIWFATSSENTTCLCYHCTKCQEGLSCLQPLHSTIFEQHVYVSKSLVHGFGLFARHSMREKDIICLYSGEHRTSVVEGNRYTCSVHTKTGEILFIDGQDKPYYSGRWANHSTVPNARLVVPLGGLLSCHDNKKCGVLVECLGAIEENEEIFIDYGPDYDLGPMT